MGEKQRETANWGYTGMEKGKEKGKKALLALTKEKSTARSETVSVRLDPQIRYFAELAARKQRRSLSNFIEWAIVQSFQNISLASDQGDKKMQGSPQTVANEIYNNTLWSYDATVRFVLLATHYPELLTHDEQALWEIADKAHLLEKGKNPDGSLNREKIEGKCLSRISEILPTLEYHYFHEPEKLNAWVARIRNWMLEDHPETESFSTILQKE